MLLLPGIWDWWRIFSKTSLSRLLCISLVQDLLPILHAHCHGCMRGALLYMTRCKLSAFAAKGVSILSIITMSHLCMTCRCL